MVPNVSHLKKYTHTHTHWVMLLCLTACEKQDIEPAELKRTREGTQNTVLTLFVKYAYHILAQMGKGR